MSGGSESGGSMSGRSVLVTGGGSGIGRATAIGFAHADADVIVADLQGGAAERTAEEIRAAGGKALAFAVNVTAPASVDSMFSELDASGGRLHTIVNCAGVTHAADGLVEAIDDDVWGQTIAVNLTGTFIVCRRGVPRLVDSGGGCIVNIASLGALIGIGLHAYSASKGGVVALTRSIGVSYASRGIRCNAIAPGPIATPMTADMLSDPASRKARLATIPAGRAGQPEEVAGLALYLASDDAAFVTGTVISIDGGAAAL